LHAGHVVTLPSVIWGLMGVQRRTHRCLACGDATRIRGFEVNHDDSFDPDSRGEIVKLKIATSGATVQFHPRWP
jgi:hypothetical protein